MNKLRIGALGPGNIFRRVMADTDMLEDAEFTAVGSSSIARAEAAAKEYGIPYAYGSYEELAASDKVDLVYIATPHNFHLPQALLSMEHGKHVLVEKPIALNEKELRTMISCAKANGVFLMEAMWTHFLPAIRDLKRRAAEGEFGPLRHLTADFSFRSEENPESRLYSINLAGGSLLDVGVYTLSIANLFAGKAPVETQSFCRKAATGTDAEMSMQLLYPDNVTAQLFCGVDVNTPASLDLYFSDAHVHVPDFWRAVGYTVFRGDTAETAEFTGEHEGHHYEFDHAAWCIRKGLAESPVLTHEITMDVVKTCEEIRSRHGILYPEEL